MINEYTGNANSFKSGIVYELDESFGDRLNLTVIVTGFKMNMLEDLTEGKVGNIIFIDSNFEYRKDAPTSEDGIELPEVRTLKIGYNKNDVRKKIVFSEDKKPALLIGEGVNRSELEHVAAIRRKSGKAERREE